MTASDPRVGEDLPLAYRPENRKEATDDLIRWLTATSDVPGNVRLPREAMNMLLAELADRDEKLAKVEALHQTKHYDKWGRTSDVDAGYGGYCSECLRFDGPSCPTMAAVAAANGGGE